MKNFFLQHFTLNSIFHKNVSFIDVADFIRVKLNTEYKNIKSYVSLH